MKIIKKVLIVFICIFMIFQIGTSVSAYNPDEIKSILDYKTVKENGEPNEGSYDIKIEKNDLNSDAGIPVIQVTNEYLLYGDSYYSSIDFFGFNQYLSDIEIKFPFREEILSNKKKWDFLSNTVKLFLKVTIAVGSATLLTLMIYIGFLIVKRGISEKSAPLPFERKFNLHLKALEDKKAEGEEIEKQLIEKTLIEEWIKSVILISFIIVFVILVLSFSNIISKAIYEKQRDSEYISVYIHSDENDSGGIPNLPADIANLKAVDLMPMGKIAYEHTFDSEGTEAIEYIINTIGALTNIAHARYPMKKSLVIAQVINESGWVSIDAPIVRDHNNILGLNNWKNGSLLTVGTTWYNKGQRTVILSMPHPGGPTDDPAKSFDNLYECVEDYMAVVLDKHPELSGSNNLEDYRGFLAGYTEDPVYDRYATMIRRFNLERFDDMADTPVGMTQIEACYFKTNIEGLYMLESQYDWDEYLFHNIIYIILGLAVLASFKVVLIVIFFLRLVVCSVITAIFPALIIINAFKKVNLEKGILKKWIIRYLIAVFCKPALGLLYFIINKINVMTIEDNPFFLPIAIIFIYFIAFKVIKRILKNNKNKKGK